MLVTGASGFIGGHLCDALLALGADVYALSRSGLSDKDRAAGVHPINLDLTELETLRTALSRVRPHLVYHLAGMVTARQDLNLVLPMLQNNLIGTVHILLALSELGCERVVVVGSSEEPDDGVPSSPYAAAKAAASLYENMFNSIYGLPVVIARLFMTYGPRQRTTKLLPYTIVSLLQEQSPYISSGERVCDFLYVLDVVRGLLMAGFQPEVEGKTVELGTGKGMRVRDIVTLLVRLIGNSTRPEFGAVPDQIEEQHQPANPTLARELLGWEPSWSLQQGLTETITWYRNRMEQRSGTR